MTDKLTAGDTFPGLSLTLTTGETLSVPSGLGDGYRIILFYRGHW